LSMGRQVAGSLPIQLFRFSERRFAEMLTRDGSVRSNCPTRSDF
jgi:hypothetical protein